MIHNSAAPTERKMAAFSSIITCQHYCRKPVISNHEDTAHRPDNWKWQGRPSTIKIYLKRTYLPLFVYTKLHVFCNNAIFIQYARRSLFIIHTCVSSQFCRHYFLICFGPMPPLQNQIDRKIECEEVTLFLHEPDLRKKIFGGGGHDDVYIWSNISNWNDYLTKIITILNHQLS